MIKVKTSNSLALESADTLIQGAMDHAAEVGKPMAIAVVDPSGELISFKRMDGAPLLAVEIAQNKAYTAVSFGIPTHEWHSFIADDEPLRLGIVHTPRLVIFGGGYPITHEDSLVGAIGVSGGHYSDDMEVATAGLRAAGLSA